MKEELPESITQREMDCIQSNLQQMDTKQFAANGYKAICSKWIQRKRDTFL